MSDSLSVLMAIFQVNLGQPAFIEAKDDEGGGDNWSYKSCKAQSNHHHQQTNIQFITGRMPSCRPTNSVKAPNGKKSSKTDFGGDHITLQLELGLQLPWWRFLHSDCFL